MIIVSRRWLASLIVHEARGGNCNKRTRAVTEVWFHAKK